MIRKANLRRFILDFIRPELSGFSILRGKDLVRVSRPLVQGVVFERSTSGRDFYVSCFVDFLASRHETISLSFGERIQRPDGLSECWRLEDPIREASILIKALHGSGFSPYNLAPICRDVLALAESREWSAQVCFGLGTCSIFEHDPGLARHYFERARARIDPPQADWDRDLLAEIAVLEKGLDDLGATQTMLRQWVEESIRLRGLQHLG